ncbi:hypothetical protein L1049_000272 [Liquidambar formosana]|uniref:Uncharacterized protein n=1 Tax=Liquidambar formosana TaxID=63359 RepID=A0AAP0NCG7_LIQFO
MPNIEEEVEDKTNLFDDKPYQLNEIPIIHYDMGGTEEGSEDLVGWCRGDIEGLSIDAHDVEAIELDEDHISEDSDTDLEEDDDTYVNDGSMEHCLDEDSDGDEQPML